eukprot:XP_001690207.1 predicted protein [Chlamydomonas reinhardtii]
MEFRLGIVVRARSAAVVMAAGRVLGGGKYTIEEVLGAGSNAVAYRARRPDGSEVALKALSLRSLRDWKQLELFEREAKTLESLSHPGIPRYVDYFEEDDPNDRAFVLVQEVVRGRSLADMLRAGQRATEQEVVRIAGEMLGVLEYLSSLRPPVIHRDVKPDNIIVEGGAWGGRVYLVDFGGVQAVANAGELSGLGSTIVGTFGYMAPEQFRGAADTASDLYGLGATLLYLLSGGGFARKRAAQRAPMPPPASIQEAYMQQVMGNAMRPPVPVSKPAGTRVELERTRTRLDVVIPPRGALGGALTRERFAVGPNKWRLGQQLAVFGQDGKSADFLDGQNERLTLKVAGGEQERAGVCPRAFSARSSTALLAAPAVIDTPSYSPHYLYRIALSSPARTARCLSCTERTVPPTRNPPPLYASTHSLCLHRVVSLDIASQRAAWVQEGSTRDLSGARVVTTAFINGVPQTAIEVLAGVNRHRFGEGLEMVEQQWLVQEINDQIAELQGRDLDLSALPPPDMPQVVNDSDRRDDDDDDRWRSR